MKSILKAALLGGITLIGSAFIGTASADSTTISDGTNNADVAINGTLGADNTDPDAPIPDGSDKWINVTLDTATIFYNTQTDTSIVSPTYNITNNSGRPVSLKVNTFKQNDSVAITTISALNVNFKRNTTSTDETGTSVSTNLISSGSLVTSFSSASSIQLANKNGMIGSTDTSGAYSNKATFGYTGSVTNKLTTMIKPTFTMNLLFTPTTWSN